MAKPNDDCSSRSLFLAAATLLALVAISFIPPVDAGGVSLRRASIFSDLVRFDGDEAAKKEADMPEIDVEEFHVDLGKVAETAARAAVASSPTGAETSVSWEGIFDEQPTGGDTAAVAAAIAEPEPAEDFAEILPPDSLIIPIEDFGAADSTALGRLYEKLLAGEPVRIAFMGDSFVEGDILTADLRESLQDTFGGGGVGFVPAASPFTGFRQTVKTTSKGWTPTT